MQPDSIAIYRDKTPVIGFVNIQGLILSGYEYHLIFKGFWITEVYGLQTEKLLGRIS